MEAKNVKEILENVKARMEQFQSELAPLIEQVKPIDEAASRADRLLEIMSADEIIEHYASRVDLRPPAVELVPSVLSAGAPGEIERATAEVLALHRMLGATIGRLTGIIAGLR